MRKGNERTWKKISLNRETLRSLEARSLQDAAAAAVATVDACPTKLYTVCHPISCWGTCICN